MTATLPLANKKLLNVDCDYEGKICEIDEEDAGLFFTLAEDFELLDELQQKLNVHGQTLSLKPSRFTLDQVNVNDLVFVQGAGGDYWYRAIVTNIDVTTTSIIVCFVDYGLREIVTKLSKIMPLPSEFDLLTYPAFAYKISLDQVNLSIHQHANILQVYASKSSVLMKVINRREQV